MFWTFLKSICFFADAPNAGGGGAEPPAGEGATPPVEGAATPPTESQWKDLESKGVTPAKVGQYLDQLRGYQDVTAGGGVEALKAAKELGLSGEDLVKAVKTGHKAISSGLEVRPEPATPPAADAGDKPITKTELIPTMTAMRESWKEEDRTASNQDQETNMIAQQATAAGLDPKGTNWDMDEGAINSRLRSVAVDEHGNQRFATEAEIEAAVGAVTKRHGAKATSEASADRTTQEGNKPMDGAGVSGGATEGGGAPEKGWFEGEVIDKDGIAKELEAELSKHPGT